MMTALFLNGRLGPMNLEVKQRKTRVGQRSSKPTSIERPKEVDYSTRCSMLIIMNPLAIYCMCAYFCPSKPGNYRDVCQ